MDRMDDKVLELIDAMEISVFAGVPRIDEMLSLAREKTRCSNVKLSVNEYDMFRATFTSIGTDDQELVGKIYDSCKIAHVWGAHSVREGYLYRCPQSIYIRELVRNENGFEADRIPIEDSKGFQTRLLDFVNASDPLASCTYCVGTVGRQQPHKLIQRDQWKLDTEQPSESLIDYDWLERSLIKQDGFDDCKIPTEADLALNAHRTSWWRRLIGTLARRRDPEPTRRRLATPVRQAAAEAKRELAESVGRARTREVS
jgi:hypothetical protein